MTDIIEYIMQEMQDNRNEAYYNALLAHVVEFYQ